MPDPTAEDAGSPAPPLVRFSRPWRWIVAGACVVTAELRILWDAPVDALSVGLLGAAVLLIFSRIKGIEWGGVSASFVDRELIKATGQLEAVEAFAEPVKPTPPPAKPVPRPVVVEPQPAQIVVEGHAPEVHVQAADQGSFREARAALALMPPTNPTERVLWAVEQIRIELVVLAGNSGHLLQRVEWPAYRSEPLAKNLVRKGVIPEELWKITTVVSAARNELVHGGLPPHSLARADTLALELLKKLREVKRQYIRVREPDPPLFHDEHLTVPYEATSAVMLVTLDDHGRAVNVSVFPRRTDYEQGRFTSWEWDLGRAFDDEAWYRDPASGQARMAWSEAATFVGRQYPEECGLEYRLPRPDAGLD